MTINTLSVLGLMAAMLAGVLVDAEASVAA